MKPKKQINKLEMVKIDIDKKPDIIKINSEVIHDGNKYLYKKDEEWECGCLSGDKDLIVFIFKCLISGAVLGFCMFMLIRKSTDGFYISTISLILGGVMGSQNNSTVDNNSKSKK